MKNPTRQAPGRPGTGIGFRRKRKGFGTLEVVIIIAVLLSVALIFRAALTDYAGNLIQTVLGDQRVIEDLALD